MKKYLWCKKCKICPDVIIEKYLEPIKEKRLWNEQEYELESSNIEEVEFVQLCGFCKTKLREIKCTSKCPVKFKCITGSKNYGK